MKSLFIFFRNYFFNEKKDDLEGCLKGVEGCLKGVFTSECQKNLAGEAFGKIN